MASVQIRHLPEDVPLTQAIRSAQARRSLAQQLVGETCHSTDFSEGQRRRLVLQKISTPISAKASAAEQAEAEQLTQWIREDRVR